MKIMKLKKLYLLGCCAVMTATALPATAASLDVTFTANIRETTCDMAIEGGSGDGKANIIPIGTSGKVSLDKVLAGDSTAKTTFKLKITECPTSLSSLKTTVSGTASGSVNTAIANSTLTTNGGADYMAVSIARNSAPNAPFKINSTVDSERLVWSAAEISSQEVELVAKLLETSSGRATTGTFSALATFNFTYE